MKMSSVVASFYERRQQNLLQKLCLLLGLGSFFASCHTAVPPLSLLRHDQVPAPWKLIWCRGLHNVIFGPHSLQSKLVKFAECVDDSKREYSVMAQLIQNGVPNIPEPVDYIDFGARQSVRSKGDSLSAVLATWHCITSLKGMEHLIWLFCSALTTPNARPILCSAIARSFLSHLPLSQLIGSRLLKTSNAANLIIRILVSNMDTGICAPQDICKPWQENQS